MSDRARRKEKQRLKRKQKRRELHRASSISPYRRAAAGELLGCWINQDWRERGQSAVWLLRRGPGGVLAMTCFFIDLWCAGLKDAWGRLDVLREDFDDAIEQSSEQFDGTVAPCTLDVARHVVAGAIRFAVQNGFRLAQRYDRWTAFLGPPLDWRNADLADFGIDGGKLRWVGPMEDLRTRYVGGRLDDFLERADVEFILGSEGTFFDEFDEEEGEDEEAEEAAFEGLEVFKQLSEDAAESARKWCIANGLEPEPMLVEAMAFSFAAMAMSAKEDEPPTAATFGQRLNELLDQA